MIYVVIENNIYMLSSTCNRKWITKERQVKLYLMMNFVSKQINIIIRFYHKPEINNQASKNEPIFGDDSICALKIILHTLLLYSIAPLLN